MSELLPVSYSTSDRIPPITPRFGAVINASVLALEVVVSFSSYSFWGNGCGAGMVAPIAGLNALAAMGFVGADVTILTEDLFPSSRNLELLGYAFASTASAVGSVVLSRSVGCDPFFF